MEKTERPKRRWTEPKGKDNTNKNTANEMQETFTSSLCKVCGIELMIDRYVWLTQRVKLQMETDRKIYNIADHFSLLFKRLYWLPNNYRTISKILK